MSRYMLPAAVWIFFSSIVIAAELPSFDFSKDDDRAGWGAAHDISNVKGSADGMVLQISGVDPYINGPARDYPENELLWMDVRLKSEQAGVCQIFYFSNAPKEANSVRFTVSPGKMQEHRVALPALGKNFKLRIDPPGSGGQAVVSSIHFQIRPAFKAPEWPRPVKPEIGEGSLSINSGALKLLHDGKSFGGFELRVNGMSMATGLTRAMIGYVAGGSAHWLDCGDAQISAKKEHSGLSVSGTLSDLGGARWELNYQFTPAKEGTIDVEVQVTVSDDRDVLFLPLFVMLPGVGSFGSDKYQGLFAGVEYLENEPSSSEKDMRGTAARRQIPDPLKITFPLMAIQAEGNYAGLIWEQTPDIAALFDSPDRTFLSGGHAMGLIFPGATSATRVESQIIPHSPGLLVAGKRLTLHATIIGDTAAHVIPAVQKYVQLKGLPPTPTKGVDFKDYVATASAGWLDSKCREGDKFRHAVWQGFNPAPAADAAIFMDWLSRQSGDAETAVRLRTARKEALAAVNPAEWNTNGISHVRYPLGSLLYGHVSENADAAALHGRGLLGQFEKDGAVLYRKSPNRDDMASTHFAPDANGLTAQNVFGVLEAAAVSGDPALKREGLRVLDAMEKFSGTVPRGAQTWEIPLHTPDIYASALLIKAYVLGYSLSGDEKYLEQARYWAWTGVPFIYLRNPTAGRAGPYASIAVLGATHWQSPVWLGNPVQWCGMTYADALRTFAKYDKDKNAPWTKLADGITATGVQFSWPRTDKERQGLLPDFYHLAEQVCDGPAINPGTVQASAVRLFTKIPLYDCQGFPKSGIVVHAPGAITDAKEKSQQIAFKVESWVGKDNYYVLLAGVKKPGRVRLNKQEISLSDPHQFVEASGRLILCCSGEATIEINWGEANR